MSKFHEFSLGFTVPKTHLKTVVTREGVDKGDCHYGLPLVTLETWM